MATSGSTDYEITGTLLIKNALIDAGIIRDDQSVPTEMETFALYRLNLLLKSYQAVGLHLWRTKNLSLILEDGKSDYTLGTGGDRWTETLVSTTLGAAEAAAQTVLTVTSSTGMTASDVVGIELDDGTMDWTTIVSVDSATQITVTTGLTSVAASSNVVYAYTSLAPQPLKVHEAYLVQKNTAESHIPLHIIPNAEYMTLPNKTTEGVPVQIQFRPERTTSELRVWPLSDDNTSYIVMTVELPLEDMDSLSDTLGMPGYWMEAIHSELTYQMGKSYGAPRESVRMFKQDSMMAKEDAKAYGVENSYIQVSPDGYEW